MSRPMKPLADCLTLAAASAVITLLAMALRLGDSTRLAGSVLLLFAPPRWSPQHSAQQGSDAQAVVVAQIVIAVLLALLPFAAMYQVQF